MNRTGTWPRGCGWHGTAAILGLAALLAPTQDTRAQDSKPEATSPFKVRTLLIDDKKADGDIAALEAELKKLQAELAKKKAEAARIADMMKKAEADRESAERKARAQVLLAQEHARAQELAAQHRAEFYRATAEEAAAKSKVEAKRVATVEASDPTKTTRQVIVLQKDGKQVLELPAHVIIAERDGKLIIEIPLAGTEAKKTAPVPPTPAVKPPTVANPANPAEIPGKVVIWDAKEGKVVTNPGAAVGTTGRVIWQVVPDGKTVPTPGAKVESKYVFGSPAQPAKPASAEDRIGNLEKKLAEILKELESLRKEMKSQPSGKVKSAAFDPAGRILAIELLGDILATPPAPAKPVVLTPPAVAPAALPPVAPKPTTKPADETSADGQFIRRYIELVTPVAPVAPKPRVAVPPVAPKEPDVPATAARP